MSAVRQFRVESLEPRQLLSVSMEWGIAGGSLGTDMANAVGVDPAGNVYVVGSFSGTMDVDPSSKKVQITPPSGTAMFVAKYSADKKLVWVSVIGGPNGAAVAPKALAVDAIGNTYIGGSFTGTVDFSPAVSVYNVASNGGEDGFVLCLSKGGKYAWVNRIGGSAYDDVRGVGVDRSGLVYAGGVFKGTASFDTTTSVISRGGKDGFVARYSANGQFQRLQAIGSGGEDAVNDLSMNSYNDSALVCGYISGEAQVGLKANETIPPDPPTTSPVFVNTTGGKDAFYATYTGGQMLVGSSGTIGGPNGNELGDAIAWLSDAFYVAGSFDTAFGSFTPVGGADIFITRPARNMDRVIGSTGDDYVADMEIELAGFTNDPQFPIPLAGNMLLTATTRGDVTLATNHGTQTLRGDPLGDVLLAEYDTNLNVEQFTSIGGPSRDQAYDLALIPGGVMLCGAFSGSIDLAPGKASAILNATGDCDWFVDRLLVT